MAKKKASTNSYQGKEQEPSDRKQNKKTDENDPEPSQESFAISNSTNTTSFFLCLVVGLFSFGAGFLSPHLSQIYQDFASFQSARLLKQDIKSKMTNIPQGAPCDKETLSTVLHENPVPGMHVLCMDQSAIALKLTMWPGAQQMDAPPAVEIPGFPNWNSLKQTLVQYFRLRPADDLHQPWAMFSLNGQLLVQETHEQVNMEGLVQMGLVLIFQGGQFVWPGVRIGYKRTIDLYSTMPVGSPDMGNKMRQATLETISLQPLVFSVEGFLDGQECDWIQQEAAPTLKYSEVTLMDMDKGRPSSDFRTSQSTFLAKNDHPMIKDLDYRTASLVRIPRVHQENVQVLRYQGGEKVSLGIIIWD